MKYAKQISLIFLNGLLFFFNVYFVNRILISLETNKDIILNACLFVAFFVLLVSLYFLSLFILEKMFLIVEEFACIFVFLSNFNILKGFNVALLLIVLFALLLLIVFHIKALNLFYKLIKIDLGIVYYFSHFYLFLFLALLLGSFIYFKINDLRESQKINVINNIELNTRDATIEIFGIFFGIKAQDNYQVGLGAFFERSYKRQPNNDEILALDQALEKEFSIKIDPRDTNVTLLDKIFLKFISNEKAKFLNVLSITIAFIFITTLLGLKFFLNMAILLFVVIIFWLFKVFGFVRVEQIDVKQEILRL